MENAADSISEKLTQSAEDLRAQAAVLEEQLRIAGRKLLKNAKNFTESAGNQARMHPFAALGLAFIAGTLVTRWLQRD